MSNTKTITVGGGCFWCIEAALQDLQGVVSAIPGYAGGHTTDPTYDAVCTGTTGHAEVVQITYDPEQIALEQLLEVFFTAHDPTQLNRQGNDIGKQYRSVIFYTDDVDKKIISDFIKSLQPDYEKEIVTQVGQLDNFYEAEAYHHNYFKKNPNAAYCQAVVRPKVEKIIHNYQSLMKNQ